MKKTLLTFIIILLVVSTVAFSCSGPEEASETPPPVLYDTPVPAEEEPSVPVTEETPAPPPEETPAPASEETPAPNPVSLTDKGYYYEVVLDYTTGLSPYEIMQAYGRILADELPDIRAAIDQFLYDLIDDGLEMYVEDLGIEVPSLFQSLAIQLVGTQLMYRIPDIVPQIPAEYVEEVDGLASSLTDTDVDSVGDGQLSANELYFFHLIGDISRSVQCSAIGVFGPLSETGSTIVGRNFDLGAYLGNYGSVTRIKKGGNSVYLIGWLANISTFTGFNDDGVFGAIVDTTGTGEPYSSTGKHAYAFDLRYALENETTMEGVADYMSRHPYGFNHLVFLADSQKSGVLENDLGGVGSDIRREIRYADSELNPGIEWAYDNAIVAVSAFMLRGNHDNFTDVIIATSRLESYKTLLVGATADGTVSWEELINIQSYDGADGVPSEMEEGDLYNLGTRRIVIFRPETFELEVFFSPDPVPPDDPVVFVKIPVSFD